MLRVTTLAAVLAVAATSTLRAQEPVAGCGTVPAPYTGRCVAAVQTAHAAQPQIGLLVAGPGSATPLRRDARRGRLSAGFRVSMLTLSIPDIVTENDAAEPPPVLERRRTPTVALGADGAVEVLRGAGGLGSVEVLGGVGYLPFDLVSREVYPTDGAQLWWTGGVRLGVIPESGVLPGLTLSLQYRALGALSVGNACEGTERPDPTPGSTQRVCYGAGDAAEARFDLSSWNARARLGRTFGPVGLGLTLGHDRHDGELHLTTRGASGAVGAASTQRIHPTGPVPLATSRWNAFLDAVVALPAVSLVGALGWMQGGERVAGFPTESAFDPGEASLHASVGARIAF